MWQGLSDAWLTTLMISLILGWLAFFVTLIIAKRYRGDFKFYEEKSKDEASFRQNFVTKEQVGEKIREAAQALDKQCKEEAKSQRSQEASELRKDLEGSLDSIKHKWRAFFNLVDTARRVDYHVSRQYRDHLEEEQTTTSDKSKGVVKPTGKVLC